MKQDRSAEVAAFRRRVFSGMDLYQLMDMEGIGAGATEHLVQEAERNHERHPDTYRALDGIRPILDALFDEASRIAGKGTPEAIVFSQPLHYAREFLAREFGTI